MRDLIVRLGAAVCFTVGIFSSIQAAHAQDTVVSFVDRFDAHDVSGWACDPESPERVIHLELRTQAGHLVATGTTGQARPDVEFSVPGCKAGGFVLGTSGLSAGIKSELSAVVNDGANHEIERISLAQLGELTPAPQVELKAAVGRGQLLGDIRSVRGAQIQGWACDTAATGSAVEIRVLNDAGRILATTIAGQTTTGLSTRTPACGTDQHGFTVDLPPSAYSCSTQNLTVVSVPVAGGAPVAFDSGPLTGVFSQPASGQILIEPVTVGTRTALRATFVPSGSGVVRRVQWFDGAAGIGETTQTPHTLQWSPARQGQLNVHAIASDDCGNSTHATVLFGSRSATIPVESQPPSIGFVDPGPGRAYYTVGNLPVQIEIAPGTNAVAQVRLYYSTSADDPTAPYSPVVVLSPPFAPKSFGAWLLPRPPSSRWWDGKYVLVAEVEDTSGIVAAARLELPLALPTYGLQGLTLPGLSGLVNSNVLLPVLFTMPGSGTKLLSAAAVRDRETVSESSPVISSALVSNQHDISLKMVTSTITLGMFGSGSVSSSPAGLSCTSTTTMTCTGSFTAGATVTLTASPASGQVFTGWLGGPPCTGTGVCALTDAGTVSARFAPATTAASGILPVTLDVDVNDSPDALTDGLLVIRYLFGMSGAALIDGAVGTGAQRATSAAIEAYLGNILPVLDIDGNGAADALTDGLLAMRYLFGMRGAGLIEGAVGTGSTRSSAANIETYLNSFCGAAVTWTQPGGITTPVVVSGSPVLLSATSVSPSPLCPVTHIIFRINSPYSNGTLVQKVAISGGVAQYQWTTAPGTYVVYATAVYAPDGINPGFSVAASSAKTITVGGAVSLTVTRAGSGTGTVTSSPVGINACSTSCSADFNSGTNVALTPTPTGGSTFAGWTGPCAVAGTVCTVSMNQSQSVTATFSLQYALSVTKAGNGAGTVSSNPVGINACGASCTANFDGGTSVALTPAASAGSTFAGWAGSCTLAGAVCTVSMSGAQSITATFVLTNLAPTIVINTPINGASQTVTSVTVNVTASDEGNLSGIVLYANGTSVGSITPSAVGGTYNFPALTGLVPGVYVLTAVASDPYLATTSTPVSITITQGVTITPPNAGGGIAGSLDGAVSVSNSGAAKYSIPIAVPPGTAGIAPNLSLNYSSQSGDGLLGYGWAIGGLSAITRCAATPVQDGAPTIPTEPRGKVSIDDQDRYCLDGQRLILVAAGPYGANDSEYRTEVDSFSKIIAHKDPRGDTAWVGVAWFEVWSKSGQKLIYGYRHDGIPGADITGQDATVRQVPTYQGGNETAVSWSLARVEDRSQNFMTIQYSSGEVSDNVDINHRPLSIAYTGNSTNGQAPYASVVFAYESRADPMRGYLAGVRTDQGKRLTTITTASSTAAGRVYTIGYVQSTDNNRSLVDSLQECDGSNTCLPASRFAWKKRTPASDNTFGAGATWAMLPLATPHPGTPLDKSWVASNFLSGDFNGDGRQDLLVADGVNWSVCAAGANLFDCVTAAMTGAASDITRARATKTPGLISGDFNGDGKTDIAIPPAGQYQGYGNWTVCLSTAAGLDCQPWYGRTVTPSPSSYYVADFNGDGRTDLFSPSDAGVGAYIRSTGIPGVVADTGFIANDTDAWPSADSLDNFSQFQNISNVDGSGRADIVRVTINGGDGTAHLAVMVPAPAVAGAMYFTSPDSPSPPPNSLVFPNTDLPYAGIYQRPPIGGTSIGQINHDGYGDVVLQFKNDLTSTGSGIVCMATGRALKCKPYTRALDVSGTAPYEASLIHVADFDGDGRADALVNRNGVWKVCQLNQAAASDALDFPCVTWTYGPVYNPNPAQTYVPITSDFPKFGPFFGDFNGDGRTDILYYDQSNGAWTVYLAGGGATPPDLLDTVTNGFGHTSTVSYRALTDNSTPGAPFYTKDVGIFAYPVRDLQDSSYVVSRVTLDNAAGGSSYTDYRYGGRKTDLAGRGLLGFRWMETTDSVSQVVRHVEFSQTFPFIGMVTLTQTYIAGAGFNLLYSQNTLTDGTASGAYVHFPRVSASTETTKDLDGSTVGVTTTGSSYDKYGNLNSRSVSTTGGSDTYASTTTNIQDPTPNESAWLIGRIQQTSINKTGPTSPTSVTRTTAFTYLSSGLLNTETLEPGDSTFTVKTTYARDNWGNVSGKSLTWRAPGAGSDSIRTVETVNYGTLGRFPETVTNALSQIEYRGYDNLTGQMTSRTDVSGQITTWMFDGFGRRTRETHPDLTFTSTQYVKCGTCPTLAKSAVISQSFGWDQASPPSGLQIEVPSVRYLDALGREIQLQTWGFDGTEIRADTAYDATTGRLKTSDRPHYTTAAAVTTTFERDALDRVTKATYPAKDGSLIFDTTTYQGLVVQYKNALNQTKTETKNVLGKLKKATDSNNKDTTFAYDPFGNLTKTTDSAQNAIVIGYDKLGRKTSLNDPDLGAWTYVVDPLGQTYKQTDAKLQVTSITYDNLGRMFNRYEYPGAEGTPGALVTSWSYDSCAAGKLCSVLSGNGYVRDQTYDFRGRPQLTTTTLNGTATYASTNRYDTFGRLQSVTHATGASSAEIGYSYNGNGYLSRIVSGNGVHWQGNTLDALSHVTSENLGNGLVVNRGYNTYTARLSTITAGPGGGQSVQADTYDYDNIGNVLSRAQLTATSGPTFTETFTYDNLNRVGTVKLNNGGPVTFTYDDLGNLTGKPGVGTYTYPTPGANVVRPHAVKTIAGNLSASFFYDNNGNLTTGNNKTFTWTSYNLPAQIDYSPGANIYSAAFTYGPEHQRFTQVKKVNGATALTVSYAGAIEKEVSNTGTVIKIYLPNGLGFIADNTPNASPTSRSVTYFLKDHLGSTIAVTDQAGTAIERLSFDAFGRRRNADGTDPATVTTIVSSSQDRHGYTGHEQLDELGLVHMNGRVYDPLLGRFTSADPTIQSPGNSQNFNRYTYVLNNPLNLTDPTGFLFEQEQTSIPSGISGMFGPAAEEPRKAPTEEEIKKAAKCSFGTTCDIVQCSSDACAMAYVRAGKGESGGSATGQTSGTNGSTSNSGRATALAKGAWEFVTQTARIFLGADEFEIAARQFGDGNVFSGIAYEAAAVVNLGVTLATGGAYKEAQLGAKVLSGVVKSAGQVGRDGEAAVRAAHDIGDKVAFQINGRVRIPDGLRRDSLTEVKNVFSLSYTLQLRDYAAFAQITGRRFDLYTRPGTTLSGPLSEAIGNGLINWRPIP